MTCKPSLKKNILRSMAVCFTAAFLLLSNIPVQAVVAQEVYDARLYEIAEEYWYGRMLEIEQLIIDWSEYNGEYDGNGYFTTTGKAFTANEGDKCYNGSVTQKMKNAGFIDYTVKYGWSCCGFARFAMYELYGFALWRQQDEMELIEYKIDRDNLDAAYEFTKTAGIGDVLAIKGRKDLDGNGTLDDYMHFMVFINYDDEGVLVLDANYNHDNSVQIHKVDWDFIVSRDVIYIYHVCDELRLSIVEDELINSSVFEPAGSKSSFLLQ